MRQSEGGDGAFWLVRNGPPTVLDICPLSVPGVGQQDSSWQSKQSTVMDHKIHATPAKHGELLSLAQEFAWLL